MSSVLQAVSPFILIILIAIIGIIFAVSTIIGRKKLLLMLEKNLVDAIRGFLLSCISYIENKYPQLKGEQKKELVCQLVEKKLSNKHLDLLNKYYFDVSSAVEFVFITDAQPVFSQKEGVNILKKEE